MKDAPKLQDYMLPVLNLFADEKIHAYEEIIDFLEKKYDIKSDLKTD